MGDLNELVERLESWSSETINQWADEYEPRHAWVKQVSQAMKKWSEASDEAAAALTSLIAERDGLEAWFEGLTPNEMHDSITRLKDRALTAEAQLRSASDALARYDAALANREHGGVAAHRCVDDLRTALSLDTNKGDGVC